MTAFVWSLILNACVKTGTKFDGISEVISMCTTVRAFAYKTFQRGIVKIVYYILHLFLVKPALNNTNSLHEQCS